MHGRHGRRVCDVYVMMFVRVTVFSFEHKTFGVERKCDVVACCETSDADEPAPSMSF